jgi:hypothetical protein
MSGAIIAIIRAISKKPPKTLNAPIPKTHQRLVEHSMQRSIGCK